MGEVWTLSEALKKVNTIEDLPREITVNVDLGKLALTPNTHIKVLNNGNNQFEVYYIDNTLTKNLVV
jgi:hypothetical protein